MELRDLEELGHFENVNVAPGFWESNQTLIANLAKMSRGVVTQTEGEGGSRFNLEDEDYKEGDSMLQWIAEAILKVDNEEEEEEEESEEGAGPSYVPEYDEEINCSDTDNDTAGPSCLSILSVLKKKLLCSCFSF